MYIQLYTTTWINESGNRMQRLDTSRREMNKTLRDLYNLQFKVISVEVERITSKI